MLILSSGHAGGRNPVMHQISTYQKVAAVTIYSLMFGDSRIPGHIPPWRRATPLLIRKWLENALTAGAAEEVEP